MNSLEFRVHGTPAAQGSKRHVGNGVMIESSKAVKPWRADVTAAALTAAAEQDWTAPTQVMAVVIFYFRRPRNHYGTGRNTDVLKTTAPYWCATTPDCDKALRSTFDALTTAGVINDDRHIVYVKASKKYADAGQPTGAHITLTPAGDKP